MATALTSLFNSDPSFEVVAQVASCADCCGSVSASDPDVIVCDLKSEDQAGFSSLSRFRHCLPDIPTVVISDDDHEQRILRVVKAGVQGFLTSDASPAKLFKAIRTVCGGGCYIDDAIQSKILSLFGGRGVGDPFSGLLNEREREILRLMSDGLTNEQIGNAVCLSKSAVKYHNKAIFRKLSVSNRAEAVKVATQQALIS
jgi:two-component system NarL family response regulator